MATSKKGTGVVNTSKKKSLSVFEIEDNVPIPPRGARDPETAAKINSILSNLKVKQSFVVPKNKVHTTQQIAKRDFPNIAIRTSIINPEKKFARIWRIK